jgi:hypothetical protein
MRAHLLTSEAASTARSTTPTSTQGQAFRITVDGPACGLWEWCHKVCQQEDLINPLHPPLPVICYLGGTVKGFKTRDFRAILDSSPDYVNVVERLRPNQHPTSLPRNLSTHYIDSTRCSEPAPKVRVLLRCAPRFDLVEPEASLNQSPGTT